MPKAMARSSRKPPSTASSRFQPKARSLWTRSLKAEAKSVAAKKMQVVALLGVVQVRARVGVEEADARRIVRLVGMQRAAHLEDARVDLDRVDLLGAFGQRDRDVVAGSGACAEDQHASRLVPEHPVWEVIALPAQARFLGRS